MSNHELYILKDFLDHIEEPKRKKLLDCLDPLFKETLESISPMPFSPSEGLSSVASLTEMIHYSWFISFLKELSDIDKYLFIGSLSQHQKEALLEHFDLSRRDFSFTKELIAYCKNQLFEEVKSENGDLLFPEFLPENPLNELLFISREELLSLVDFLSLHDLSVELKTVIRSSHLIKIFSSLSESQRKYLTELKTKIEPVVFKPLGLNSWNGDETILKKALHQRGLNRLAKALSTSHPSLVWYLIHKLDIGRASIVQTLIKEIKNKKAQTILINQVQELLRLQKAQNN